MVGMARRAVGTRHRLDNRTAAAFAVVRRETGRTPRGRSGNERYRFCGRVGSASGPLVQGGA
jgi:hypothetical protein